MKTLHQERIPHRSNHPEGHHKLCLSYCFSDEQPALRVTRLAHRGDRRLVDLKIDLDWPHAA
jgi:hypothetical protein